MMKVTVTYTGHKWDCYWVAKEMIGEYDVEGDAEFYTQFAEKANPMLRRSYGDPDLLTPDRNSVHDFCKWNKLELKFQL